MSHGPFSLFYHSVLLLFDCFSVMIHCISKEASLRAKQFCVLTTTESRAKIWRQLNAFKPPPPGSLGCCPFKGGGSVVVDLLFNVLPIVC